MDKEAAIDIAHDQAKGAEPLKPPAEGPFDFLYQIPDAYLFMQAMFPDIEPYRWQIETLLQLSGYADPYKAECLEPTKEAPMFYTLCAANGSGKDQIVLTVWALYSICCKKNFHWIGTSASYKQLDEQTWRHIQTRANELNKYFGRKFLTILKHKVKNTITGSEITLFRSDEDVKTEGFHPLVPGGQMAIVLNECKSIEPAVVMAYKRCHGYTHWLNISSPGAPIGFFYDRCAKPDQIFPEPVVLGKNYFRRVDYSLCPHLHSEFNRAVDEFGIESPFVQSSFLAQFVSSNLMTLLTPEQLNYKYPAPQSFGMPRRAGLDLSLGGDATVLSVWEGNYHVGEFEYLERYEPKLTRLLVSKLAELGVPPSQVYADAGNMGATIIQRMGEEGYPVNGVHNQGRPRNKRAFENRGVELAFNLRRLICDRILNLSACSDKLKRQMTKRMYTVNDRGMYQLEDKTEFRARMGYSPDNLDAAILAQAGITHHIFKTQDDIDPADDKRAADNAAMNKNWKQEWEAIYGRIDTKAANSGAYRTSGSFAGRQIGRPLRRLAKRVA